MFVLKEVAISAVCGVLAGLTWFFFAFFYLRRRNEMRWNIRSAFVKGCEKCDYRRASVISNSVLFGAVVALAVYLVFIWIAK